MIITSSFTTAIQNLFMKQFSHLTRDCLALRTPTLKRDVCCKLIYHISKSSKQASSYTHKPSTATARGWYLLQTTFNFIVVIIKYIFNSITKYVLYVNGIHKGDMYFRWYIGKQILCFDVLDSYLVEFSSQL